MTILEFAEEILALSGSQSKIVFKPLPQDDPEGAQAGHHAGPGSCSAGSRRSIGTRG